MFNSKASLMSVIALSLLFIVAMGFTITYAYFTATRTTVTTLNFHGGTALTVVGAEYDTNPNNVGLSIAQNAKTGQWQSKTDGGSWTTSNSAVVNSSLVLSGLKVKAAQNSGTYVRVFVAVKVDNISTPETTDGNLTVPDLTFVTEMGSSVATVETAYYTNKERQFISSNTSSNTTLHIQCVVVTLPNNYTGFVKFFDDYTVFNKSLNEVQDANYQFSNISAMIMLTSSTSNRFDIWQTSQEDSTYSFTY